MKRYAVDLVVFGSFFMRQWWMMRQSVAPRAVLPETTADVVVVENRAFITMEGRLTSANASRMLWIGQEALNRTPHLYANLKRVDFLDSAAIGALVGLAKQARDAGGDLALVDVPDPIQRTLNLLRLETFFVIYDSVDTVVNPNYSAEIDAAMSDADADVPVLKVPRRLDALTVPALAETWTDTVRRHGRVVVDFSETVLLASVGLALLAQLRQAAEMQEGRLCVAACSDDVVRVLELARFDKLLSVYESVPAAVEALLEKGR